jgi:hypothetical protein
MTQNSSEIETKMMTRAQALLDAMAQREYRNAIMHFDTTMTSLMPADKVEELWTAIVGKVGSFVEKKESRMATIEGRPIVILVSKFEKDTIDIYVTFDANANISGLHVGPDKAKPAAASASASSEAAAHQQAAEHPEAPAQK